MTDQFKLNFAPGHDGRLRAIFHDLDGFQCRLRGCSCADGGLTLGLVGPRDFGMMHLSREMAREIGRALIGFTETGKLGEGGEDASQNLQNSLSYQEQVNDLLQANQRLSARPASKRTARKEVSK